jgi:hypothetical protein
MLPITAHIRSPPHVDFDLDLDLDVDLGQLPDVNFRKLDIYQVAVR